MYEITKDFHFSASHRLDGLADGHQCGRLHGHNYIAQIGVTADLLDGPGFVLDFGDLGFVTDKIDSEWDHRHLNDVLPFNPTAEHMAKYLADYVADTIEPMMPGVFSVKVGIQETPKCWAYYTTGWRQM